MSRYSFKKLVLYTSVYLLLGISNLLIKIISFKHLVRLLTNSCVEFHPILSPRKLFRISSARQAIFTVSRRTPWRSKCFEQAITASILLKMMRVSHKINFGLNNDENELKAHAWVMVNNVYITGFSTEIEFIAVSSFYYTSKKDRV